jgi:hypothetical protein
MARKVRDQLKKVNGEDALARYLQAGIIKQRDYGEAMKKLKAGPYSEEQ